MHDLDESGNVAHYDVLFGHGVEKNVPVSSLEILEGHMHEHVIVDEKISASGYARAKKYREDHAREKNRRENPQQAEFFREVDKIKAAKAKRKERY